MFQMLHMVDLFQMLHMVEFFQMLHMVEMSHMHHLVEMSQTLDESISRFACVLVCPVLPSSGPRLYHGSALPSSGPRLYLGLSCAALLPPKALPWFVLCYSSGSMRTGRISYAARLRPQAERSERLFRPPPVVLPLGILPRVPLPGSFSVYLSPQPPTVVTVVVL